MSSVAKLPYEHSQDGISYTFSIGPRALSERQNRSGSKICVVWLDGYFHDEGHHINVNVFDRETLIDAMTPQKNIPS